ncbi:MAG TPA: T9SS type A sorting domain-containing protein [Bacteroidia bacterium]|nr:T9SS type A sorting domain-containing protein [Bacteroidia bacterium]
MKKLVLFSALCLPAVSSNAQTGMDTLLWENFNFENIPPYIITGFPPGVLLDTSWYNLDLDMQADQSGVNRPDEWFSGLAFSDVDTVGNSGVFLSNSWTFITTAPVQNFLITKAIFISDTTAELFWKSAPYQTPRYLDGYQVLVSTGDNDPLNFTDTLFRASEYDSLVNSAAPNDFASYAISPAPGPNPLDPFVHGIDGTYVEFTNDSARLLGQLRPFNVSLAQYSGMWIYIAIVHGTIDDNLLSIDDVLVTGTDITGLSESSGSVSFIAFPNPVQDIVTLQYTLPASTPVTINVYNVAGQLVKTENKGPLAMGEQQAKIDLGELAAGAYRVELVTESGSSNSKVIVE